VITLDCGVIIRIEYHCLSVYSGGCFEYIVT